MSMCGLENWHGVNEQINGNDTQQAYIDRIQNKPWHQYPSGTSNACSN